jgi:hypothetical protein
MRFLSLPFIYLAFVGHFATGQQYAMLPKDSPLLRNAHAIVRVDSAFMEIKGPNKYARYCKFAVTILNAKGKSRGEFEEDYDEDSDIKKISIRIYDKEGKCIKEVKSSEIKDRSLFAYQDQHLSDTRIKSYEPDISNYPYTIEWEFTKTSNNMFWMGNWYFQSGEHVGVVSSTYVMKVPETFQFHYKLINADFMPKVQKVEGGQLYTWRTSYLEPIEMEPFGPSPRSYSKYLLLCADQFEYGSIKGSYSSWQSLGKWDYELNKGRDVLPLETVKHMKDLTANAMSDQEKINIIYHYVQSKTRYESVQLGVGGFQTFPASYVDKYSVGDCKALSNYTMALLKAVGITSYCSSVYADRNGMELVEDFPSQQFNHVILCIPHEKDTTWLECTSTSKTTGFLGSFTDSRKALLATPRGGFLVNTSSYSKEDNNVTRSINVYPKGVDARLVIASNYSGLMAEERLHVLPISGEKQLKWFQEEVEVPHTRLEIDLLKCSGSKIPKVEEKITLESSNILSISKEGYLCFPVLYEGQIDIPESMETRTQPVVIPKSYQTSDTIRYHFPLNAKIEPLPDIQTTSRFGTYSMTSKVEEGYLVWVRTLTLSKGTYPKETYSELVKFLKTVGKGDRTKALASY